MEDNPLFVLLADDDKDDCFLFQLVLEDLQLNTHLTTVHDGEKLMQLLTQETNKPPSVLFLDLNMPRKNGFESLVEIKLNEKLKTIPIIIFSTSFEKEMADLLYQNGANFYICKPSEFSELTKVIYHVLTISAKTNFTQPTKDKFLLTGK